MTSRHDLPPTYSLTAPDTPPPDYIHELESPTLFQGFPNGPLLYTEAQYAGLTGDAQAVATARLTGTPDRRTRLPYILGTTEDGCRILFKPREIVPVASDAGDENTKRYVPKPARGTLYSTGPGSDDIPALLHPNVIIAPRLVRLPWLTRAFGVFLPEGVSEEYAAQNLVKMDVWICASGGYSEDI